MYHAIKGPANPIGAQAPRLHVLVCTLWLLAVNSFEAQIKKGRNAACLAVLVLPNGRASGKACTCYGVF